MIDEDHYYNCRACFKAGADWASKQSGWVHVEKDKPTGLDNEKKWLVRFESGKIMDMDADDLPFELITHAMELPPLPTLP